MHRYDFSSRATRHPGRSPSAAMKDTRDERGDPGLRAHPLQIDAKPIVASARWLQSQAWPVIAALIGTLAFMRVYGTATLNPTHLEWLIHGDFSQHLFGWLFFRNDQVGWPLGRISSYIYPLGTTVGLTDSTPWVALLLRPFSSVLPANFQYI